MPRPYSAHPPAVGAGHARPGLPRITRRVFERAYRGVARRGTSSTVTRIPLAEDFMRLFVFFLLAAALVLSAADGNVSGKWSGSFSLTRPDGTNDDGTAFAVLKQEGGADHRHRRARTKNTSGRSKKAPSPTTRSPLKSSPTRMAPSSSATWCWRATISKAPSPPLPRTGKPCTAKADFTRVK